LEYAQRHFDVFVTIYRSLERQHVPNNRIQSYKSIFGDLKAAAEQVKAGQIVVVMSSLLRGTRPG